MAESAANGATVELAWLTRFIDGLSDGAAYVDSEGRVVATNALFRRMLSGSSSPLATRPQWSEIVAALPVVESEYRSDFEHLRTLRASGVAIRLGTVKGADLEVDIRPGPAGGRMVILRQLGAAAPAKPVERALIEALHRALVGLVLLDADDRIVLWNQPFADVIPLVQVFHGQRLEEFIRACCTVGGAWSGPLDAEEWIVRRMYQHTHYTGPFEEQMGGGRWFLTSEHRSEEGATLIIHVEITAQKMAESALIVARDQADRANRAKSQFLANMSHELRTPLNAIMGFSEVIRDQSLGPVGSPRYAEYAGDIHESGRHLLELVNTILDLAKIEADQFELDVEPIDMAVEIAATIRLFDIRAQRAGLTLAADLAAESPVVQGDRRAVRQMLLNLLSNAVKFTPPGGRVTVSARQEPDAVVVAVRDDGPGIAAEDLPRALEPFGQVATGNDAENVGTGLGLPLVRALIERHGGRFQIDTAPGEGTRVSLSFPI